MNLLLSLGVVLFLAFLALMLWSGWQSGTSPISERWREPRWVSPTSVGLVLFACILIALGATRPAHATRPLPQTDAVPTFTASGTSVPERPKRCGQDGGLICELGFDAGVCLRISTNVDGTEYLAEPWDHFPDGGPTAAPSGAVYTWPDAGTICAGYPDGGLDITLLPDAGAPCDRFPDAGIRTNYAGPAQFGAMNVLNAGQIEPLCFPLAGPSVLSVRCPSTCDVRAAKRRGP